MECAQRIWIIYIVFSFGFLTGERHLITGTAKKGILTLNYGSKDMLLWKRGSVFVSTEDENLWIPYRLMWFIGTRTPERSPLTSKITSLNKKQKAV